MRCPKCGGELKWLYEDFFGRGLCYCRNCDRDYEEQELEELRGEGRMISERTLMETMNSYEKTIKHIWQMGYSQGFSDGKDKAVNDLIQNLRQKYPDKAEQTIILTDNNDARYRE